MNFEQGFRLMHLWWSPFDMTQKQRVCVEMMRAKTNRNSLGLACKIECIGLFSATYVDLCRQIECSASINLLKCLASAYYLTWKLFLNVVKLLFRDQLFGRWGFFFISMVLFVQNDAQRTNQPETRRSIWPDTPTHPFIFPSIIQALKGPFVFLCSWLDRGIVSRDYANTNQSTTFEKNFLNYTYGRK
jgi:hypothetical protein